MRYLLVAGEASGDEHGARLIASLRALDTEAHVAFVGGDKMAQQAGVAPLYHYRDIAVMGVSGVLRNIDRIRQVAHIVQREMQDNPPDIVIPIDYGGFNLRYVLPEAHRCGLPLVYYIPPKVWASRHGRIKSLRQYADLCLTILPFEANYLCERGVKAHYVGNPSFESVGNWLNTNAHICDMEQPYIALLPGSRKGEIERNLPVMCQAVDMLPPPWRAVIAVAPSLTAESYTPYIGSSDRISLGVGDTYQLLAKASGAIVTSGTATLETTLIGTPQVVTYKIPMGPIARWALDHLLPIRYFSLSNLILDRAVVTELLGDEVTPQRLIETLIPLLDRYGDAYQMQQELYAEVRQQLYQGEPATQTAAQMIYDRMLNR